VNNSTDVVVSDPSYETLLPPYGDDLAHAGIAANVASADDVFTRYREELAENTRRRQQHDFVCFCAFLREAGVSRTPDQFMQDPLAWAGMTHGIVRGFLKWMSRQGYSTGTMGVRLATIRKYCFLVGPPPDGMGVLSENDLAAILTVKSYRDKRARNLDKSREDMGIPTRKGKKKAQATEITTDQALRLKKTSRPGRRSHDEAIADRDALMAGLLIELALRCSEVHSLNIEDINLQAGTIRIYRQKTARSKDETENHSLPQHSRIAAERYLSTLGRTQGPLFLGYNGNRLSTRAINERIGVLGEIIGVEALSPHDLRHFWAFDAFRNQTPLDKVQSGGGWKTAEMPLRYARRAGIANDGVKITEE
jgi:integrase